MTAAATALPGRAVPIALAIGVAVVAAVRILVAGWAGVAPDDARYVYVGLATLDGNGPLTPDGAPFLLRSPVYGVALAIGSRLFAPISDGDPLLGARAVAVVLSLLGLAAAVRFAWLEGGPVAAAGAAGFILATPLLWRLVPSLRIDLVQTAGVVATLLLLRRPTNARWAAAGLVLGLTILVKESVLLLVALPLAWLGEGPFRSWLVRSLAFAGMAVLVAGWWWVVVWIATGEVFPANALAVIERRQVGADLAVGPGGAVVAIAAAASWVIVARLHRRRSIRALLLAAALLAPPAAYAFLNGLDARNYAGLAVLSAIAAGLALRRVLEAVAARGTRLVPFAVALAVVAVGVGQVEAGAPYEPPLPARIAAELGPRVDPGERIVMTFRFRALVALALYGRTTVDELRPARVGVDDDPADFVWIGLRDRQLFGYRRGAWTRVLGDPAVRYLAVVEPHFFAPVELEPFLASDLAGESGLTRLSRLEPGGPSATIYEVRPAAIASGVASIPVHVTAAASRVWLGDTGDEGALRFVASEPVVTGSDIDADELSASLRGAGCVEPAGPPFADGWLRIRPPGSCS